MNFSKTQFSKFGRILVISGFVAGNIVAPAPALAGPSGGRIIAGQGGIGHSGSTSTINQGSDRLIIEWDSFDTNANESVRFNQPSSSASVLNRIISGNATTFDGSLFANGNVVIVNGSGIHFGPNSHVDVGSLIASTADISNRNFLDNRLIFDRPGRLDASITNAGTITVRDSGLAALVAPGVENSGLIQANLGTVILAAGEAHTIDFNGDGLMAFAITKPTSAKPKDRNGNDLDALASNSGSIHADGGTVLVTARQASHVLDNAINMSGVVRANSVGVRNGKIVLFGGKKGRVNVSGRISASGKRAGERGGNVHITGQKVAIPIAKIDVTGKSGGGEVLVGGAYKGGKLADDSPIGYLQTGDLVSILTGDNAGAAGNGYIPSADSVTFGRDAVITAGSEHGNGGDVVIWGTNEAYFHGLIDTLGGNGGSAEVSTKGTGVIDGTMRSLHSVIDPGDVCVGSVANCAFLFGAVVIDPGTILTTLNSGGFFQLNTDATGTNFGSGEVVFAGLEFFDVNNNTGIAGTFRIESADTITVGDQFFIGSSGSTGTNYEWFAGDNSFVASPSNSADIIFGSQLFDTGGGQGTFDANDDIVVNGPIITGGGNLSLIARGSPGASEITLASSLLGPGGSISTIDGNGNAGEVLIRADNVFVTSLATPLVDADGAGGMVTIETASSGRSINLGTKTGTALSFTDLELLLIETPVLRIGNSDSGSITISDQIARGPDGSLELRTGGSVMDGTASEQADLLASRVIIESATGIGGTLVDPSDDLDIQADSVLFTNNILGPIGPFNSVNISNTGTVSAVGATRASSVALAATSFNVQIGASIDTFGTINVDTPGTVNLDGNLTASLGISGNATIVNVQGSTGGAEIQDGVDLAASGATINVVSGTYSGFTIDKDGITVIGDSATPVVNAANRAITIAADRVTVQNMLLQGAGMPDQVGILLDGTASPNLTGITITNVDFDNLDDGIRSQGDIGDGNPSTVDITIAGNSDMDPALFTDFLGSAIDVGDTDGDAVYSVTDIIVRDGADVGTAAAGEDGIRFGAIGGAGIQRASVTDTNPSGIRFDAQTGAVISVLDSSIMGETDGILIDGLSGSTATIANNDIDRGIRFAGTIDTSTVTIAGNTVLNPLAGIEINAALIDSNVLIGGGTAMSANNIVGQQGGIGIGSISGGSLVIANNQNVSGFRFHGLVFGGAISNGARVEIIDNASITSSDTGIEMRGAITGSTITVAGNNIGGTLDTIRFDSAATITDSTVTIGSAAVTVDGTALTPGGNTLSGGGTGIRVRAAVAGNTDFIITDNQIGMAATRIIGDGIQFENGILGTATVIIGGANQVFAGGHAINVAHLQSPSTLSVTGGTYNGTGGALLVDNSGVAGTDGRLNVGTAAYVSGAGTNVLEVLTDAGNAGVDIDFAGGSTFDGGAIGVRLSGPGIDIVNNTFDSIVFGSTTPQTGNFIELADGAEFLPASPTPLDATGVSFEGTLGSALTLAQLFALETRLVHFPDNPTLGVINTNDLFVVNGESIQTAVNAAGQLAAPQTVTVTAGTFGGSVEVWVNDLTLTGQGATTIIDTDTVDPFANNMDADNGFQIASISATVGSVGDVTGVTIQGFAFDTLTTVGSNIGIELGETLVSDAVNTTVRNNVFTDLNTGIQSNQSSGTTPISDNTMTAIAARGITFEDTLNTGDVVTVSGNTISSRDTSVRFAGALDGADVTVADNTITSENGGIQFLSDVRSSFVSLTGNELNADVVGIWFSDQGPLNPSITDSTVDIVSNTIDANIFDPISAIVFEAIDGSSTVTVRNNTVVAAREDGLVVQRFVRDTAFLDIDGNMFGSAGSLIGSGAMDGNGLDIDEVSSTRGVRIIRNAIFASDNGIEFDGGVSGAPIEIVENTSILGENRNGISFDTVIDSGASIRILDNPDIVGGEAGVAFLQTVTDSTIRVADNTNIAGGEDGIRTSSLSNSVVTIQGNDTIRGTNNDGILLQNGISNGSTVAVAGNNVTGGTDGIEVASDLVSATILIGGSAATANSIVGGQNGITGANISGGSFTIANNTLIEGTNANGILFGGAIQPGAVVGITDNTSITGGTDGIAATGTIQGALTIAGNDMITGTTADGISFSGDLVDATLLVGGNSAAAANSIFGRTSGVSTALIRGGSVTIAGNTTISGDLEAAILLGGELQNNADVDVVDNDLIFGGNRGFASTDTVTLSSISIAGNRIRTINTGIEFSGDLIDAIVEIGGAPIQGNDILSEGTAISAGTITGGSFRIANNSQILSDFISGIVFTGDISGGAGVEVSDNGFIQGQAFRGIDVQGAISASTVTIARNTLDANSEVIRFGDLVTNSTVSIAGNTLTMGNSNTGISFDGAVNGTSDVSITGNQIGTSMNRTGGDGIRFAGGILDQASVILDGVNQVFATGLAVNISHLQSPTTLSITGGTYNGTGGALLVDNTGVAGTDGGLNIGTAAYVASAGTNVLEVLTDAGNAGVDIDFSGSATIDGGATGILLSGPGIDVLGDTFGSVSFGATTPQTGNFIELADGAEFLPGSPTPLDATGVSFGGILGRDLTLAQLFALEDRLVHYPDNPTLGVINTNDLFVGVGESIQTAVNAAGLLVGPQTVTVTAGTFGGSVEVWVDDLTLSGQGATTIIDTDAVDPFANNMDVDNGFQIAAISQLSGGGDVSGVIIEGFAFDTVTTVGSNTGIELGETAISAAAETVVRDNTFDDLDTGILSNQSSGTTGISDNTMTALAGRGISFGNALAAGDIVTISGNTISSDGNAVHFDDNITDASVTISQNSLTSAGVFSDGVRFDSTISGSTILVQDNSSITGSGNGIRTGSVSNTAFSVLQNVEIIGGSNVGILFSDDIENGSIVEVAGNTGIRGEANGILVEDTIGESTVTIAGNTQILGNNLDAIAVGGDIEDSDVTIGSATVTVNNVATAFGGNSISGGENGIRHQSSSEIEGTSVVTISDNEISGLDSGIHFGRITDTAEVKITGNLEIEGRSEDGILVTDAVTDNASMTISDNRILGEDDGIEFEGRILDNSIIAISNNTIEGDFDGIEFEDTIADQASVTISGNTITTDRQEGVEINGLLNQTFLLVDDNKITAGNDGVIFEGRIADTATTTISANRIIAEDNGISFQDEVETANINGVRIINNSEITGTTEDGIRFAGTVTGTAIEIDGNPDINGAVNGILFEGGINGAAIKVSGNTSVSGGEDGIRVSGLSNSTFSILENDAILGNNNDGILFQEAVTNGSTVEIAGNTVINGGQNGITARREIIASTFAIAGNAEITGDSFAGIDFRGEITDANVTVGAAMIPVNGVNTAFAGNTISGGGFGIVHNEGATIRGTSVVRHSDNDITGGIDGIFFESIIESADVTVADNSRILGVLGEGILFFEEIENNAAVTISGNAISGGDDGIEFRQEIQNDVLVGIADNTIAGGGDGVEVNGLVDQSSLTLTDNTITGNEDGVIFTRFVEQPRFNRIQPANIIGNIGPTGNVVANNAAVTIDGNTITGGEDGVSFAGSVQTANANGIRIFNNTEITGKTGNGVVFEHTVTDTIVEIGGNPDITGAVNGVEFASLSGSSVNASTSGITGGENGFKASGATSVGSGNTLTLSNLTLRGTIGPGLAVTTIAGGAGIVTNLAGGVTLEGTPSMALSGPNQELVGNSLNDTRFDSSDSGNFVELSNGALFEPGQPTLIDGRLAFFNGVQAPDQSPPPLIQAIEDRLIDFDDDITLGQIFFTPATPGTQTTTSAPPGEAPAPEFVLTHFPFLLETGVRTSNPQSPGDWVQRPDFLFDILFGDLFAMAYPLGGCEPVFDASGVLVNIQCVGPAQGSNISPFIDAFMANLNPAGP